MSSGINHQVGVKASPEDVYKALTETQNLAQWWTTDTRGSGAKVGARRLEGAEGSGCRRMGGD
jgi:uncharacterized protein YndB with AHSA1/START domain